MLIVIQENLKFLQYLHEFLLNLKKDLINTLCNTN